MNDVSLSLQSSLSDAYAAASNVISREIAYLDDRQWEQWLALYAADCEYWVPAWLTEAQLGSDPGKHLSHVYYANRAGLEDRVLRITSGRSAASTPLRRTCHQLTNLLVLDCSEQQIKVRCASSCLSYDPHSTQIDVFFGSTYYTLRRVKAGWAIASKKIVLLNDTMPTAVDIYSL